MVKIPTLKELMIGFVFGLFAIQIVSLLLNSMFPSIPLFKGGQAILLVLLASIIIAMFMFGDIFRGGRRTFWYIIGLTALMLVAYWKLPEMFPQIFQIEPGVSQSIKQAVGSILG